MKVFTVLLLLGLFITRIAGGQDQPEYLPGKIIIKYEPDQLLRQKATELGVDPKEQVQELMNEHGITRYQPVFREGASNAVRKTLAKRSIATPADDIVDGLTRTFYIDYSSVADPRTLSRKLSEMPGVVYAEPHFVYYLFDEPNDPLYGTEGQDFFEYQNFVDAWEVSKSSTDVVIAIIDSGVFYNHPDLLNKLHRIELPSPASEAFEAVVDDSIGWDFWESGDVFNGEDPVQDNDPIAQWSTHGTHVAGIAAAETNNNIGIAGTGYNASFMPVKVGGTQQYPDQVPFGTEGILYAALNGADIINTSYGSSNFSEFGREVIDLATEMGALVVSSAGNNGNDHLFYPASFQNTLSVGSVDTPSNNSQNSVSGFSSYGYNVDVFATGRSIRSTAFEYDRINDEWIFEPDSLGYILATGTSMSAPVVSGLAALLKHQNPDWSSQRLAFQIRNSASTIDDVPVLQYQLGQGVINASSALTADKPGLEITSIKFKNEDGNSLNVGDEGFAEIVILNHGALTTPSITIFSLVDNITTASGDINIGSIATDQSISLVLPITIGTNYDLDEEPVFAVEYSDGNQSYRDFSIHEYDDLLYENVASEALTMSIPNDGTIGFREPFEQEGGVGFIPAGGDNLLFEGGIMIHAVLNDTAYVPNQVRFEDSVTRDFSPIRNIEFQDPQLSDIEYSAAFNSSGHPKAKDLEVLLETFAFEKEGLNQSVFLRYTITNTSSISYNDVHVGLFNDWDVGSVVNNYVDYSEPDSLLYVYDGQNEDQPFVAVAHMGVISSAFAIDNVSEMSLGQAETKEDSLSFGIYYDPFNTMLDGFTQREKELALTSGVEKTSVENTDISTVTGTGPFILEENGEIQVGFIYAYGNELDDLRNQVQNARESNIFAVSPTGIYRNGGPIVIPEIIKLYQNYPNPFNNTTIIEYDLPEASSVTLDIFNILGQRITTLVNETVNEGRQSVTFETGNLASGVYLAVLRTEHNVQTIKMSLVK
ncbi:MAG: S8/S53 family peptidase [Balneolales bacterium]